MKFNIKSRVVLSVLIFNNIYSIKIYEIFPDLCKMNSVESLYNSSVKNLNINKNVNFVVTQWPVLLKNSWNKKHPNLDDLPKIKFNGGFTVCSCDNFEKIIPYWQKLGIDTVFAPCAINKKFNNLRILSIPYPVTKIHTSASTKDILYSFIGATTNKVRDAIFKMRHSVDAVIIKRDTPHFLYNKEIMEKNLNEFYDILSRSRYSLCPRGFGPGSIRFWESLQVGSIPILISDDYLLPEGFDWTKCVIQVKEKDIKTVPVVLSKISKKHEEIMRNNCYKAYSLYSGDNFISVVRQYYK